MLMVDTDLVEVERLLLGGELACPSCSGTLRPWGYARWRSSRQERDSVRHRPRRTSCSACGRTHALLARATGAGHRPIAAMLGRPASTVRGWLRRFGARAEEVRVLFTRLPHALDPEAGPLLPRGSVFADALEALGRAGAAAVRRPSPGSPWEFASRASAGLLLTPAPQTAANQGR